jgi:phosphoglycerate dehydrogenase-like enzyme
MAYCANRTVERILEPPANPVTVIGLGALGSLIADRPRAPCENVPLVDRNTDHAGLLSEVKCPIFLGGAGVDNGALERARVATVNGVVVTAEGRGHEVAIRLVAPTVRGQVQNAVKGDDGPRAQPLDHASASDAVVGATLVDRLGKTSA